jgi:hypothetical protein
MKLKIIPPEIPEDQQTPLVKQLLLIIETQASIIDGLNEQVQQLKDEIARLKNQPPRPKIRPSQLEGNRRKKSKPHKGKRPGSEKKAKTAQIKIHDIESVEPDHIPEGSQFRDYKDFVIQDIKFEPFNTLYRMKVYMTPGGGFVCGKLPEHLEGKHFGPTLESYILNQYHHCHVTQPLLLEQLHEMGIDISSGTLSNIITESKDEFHAEKDAILAAGLKASNYIHVDDTGARHNGQNGYCTHIGNELFSFFESTKSKSRINFLKLLRAGHTAYAINPDAIAYMQANHLPQYILQSIMPASFVVFDGDHEWRAFLDRSGIVKQRHIQVATEGALIGSIIEHGLSDNLVIISDDAGQFNVLRHALCWIHAERTIDKIVPFTDQAKDDLKRVRGQIWDLYQGLKQYKQQPDAKSKQKLESLFDDICRSSDNLGERSVDFSD